MKSLISLLLLSLIATSFVVTAGGYCWYHGHVLSTGVHTIDCVKVTCDSNGTVHTLECPLIKIECGNGTHVVKRLQDNSKPYSDCCPLPHCVKDN